MTSSTARIAGPLDGVRVLDLSQVVSGPICGRVLSDLGADVVKVEPPEGDVIRTLEPRVGDEPVSVYFTWANAGKRSVSIDVRTPRGSDLVRALADTSDVVLENFRPGVLEKFGLDADTLLARQPTLVYCGSAGHVGAVPVRHLGHRRSRSGPPLRRAHARGAERASRPLRRRARRARGRGRHQLALTPCNHRRRVRTSSTS